MRILGDGTVEIKNKRTGATKVIKPDELPNYGIAYDSYVDQAKAYEQIPNTQPVLKPEVKPIDAAEAGKLENAKVLREQTLQTAKDLKGRDYGKITGLKSPLAGKLGALLGSPEQATKNKYDQLKSLLTLDNIRYLKGTGQISDKEQEILTSAATSLGQNLSNKDFGVELDNIINNLGGTVDPEKDRGLVAMAKDKNRNPIVNMLLGGGLDMANDIGQSLNVGAGQDAVDQNLDIAEQEIKKLNTIKDPEKRKEAEKYIDSLLNSSISQSNDNSELFSNRVDVNPALRGLEVGAEVANVAALPGLLKSVLGGVGKKLPEAVSTISKGGTDDLLQKGVNTMEKVKQYTPGNYFGGKQAEAASRVTTQANIPQKLIDSASKLARADKDAARQLVNEENVIKGIKDIPTLLERMQYWGKSAYSSAGGVKAGAKANLYKDFYRSGLDILKTEAPEVYKYRRLLAYTHELPTAIGKNLWKLVLGKTLITGL